MPTLTPILLTLTLLAADPIALDNRLELFVDHHLIDSIDGATLKLHEPRREGVALTFDRPYEGKFSAYVTVIHDQAQATYRMYYRGIPEAGEDGSSKEVTCYAQSPDGITWTKPNLNIHQVEGTKNNNIILANMAPFTHNFSPFLDQNPAASSEQRYKALAGTSSSGLHAFTSPDGIHWTKSHTAPVITQGAFDSQNVAFFSQHEKRYICYFRTWSKGEWSGYRTISRTTSPDFQNWTDPQPMTFGDTPMEHLYTNQTHPYFRAPHLYIATPMRFMPGRQVLTLEQARSLGVHIDDQGKGYASDCADAVFMTTRGGTTYDRTFMEALIRPGTDLGNWASRAGMTALGIVPTGPNQISLYKQAHYAQPTAHLLRYTLRTDGFASLHGPYAGGNAITKALTHTGTKLILNYATSAAGHILIELQDQNGTPIPNYTLKDADPTIGDNQNRPATWNNSPTLPTTTPIRLNIHLKDADLYSLQFTQ